MKICVLYDVWEGTEEYPGASAETEPDPEPKTKTKTNRPRKKKEKRPKLDREEIFDALTKLGHEPFYQTVDGYDASLVSLARCKGDLFFNLTESYAGDDTKDMH